MESLNYIVLFMMFAFIGIVFTMTKMVVLQLELQADKDILMAKDTYQQIIEQKRQAGIEKANLEREAAQIFTLYDMMREITKNFNELEAFNVFRRKLQENITFEDCQLLDVSSEKIREVRTAAGYSLFVLKSKEKKLGYLVHKGIPEAHKEKFLILAHQFSLALRRIKLYKDIEKLAITDSLTGVHTRRYFLERMEEEIKRSDLRKIPLSVLMLDVDHFKQLNDKYGHLTGDRVLKEVGAIIKDKIREIDIAGRYGGEEFSVVLPDTDSEGALLAAERIRSAVEKAVIQAYDNAIKITISIGISTFPQDGIIIDALIDKADWSLYRAKSKGRNCVVAFGQYSKEDRETP